MKRIIKALMIMLVICLALVFISNNSYAAVDTNTISSEIKKLSDDEKVEELLKSIKEKGQTKENIYEAIELYKDLSKLYDNNEIVQKLKNTEEYKNSSGTLSKTIDTLGAFLEGSSTEKINKVLDDLDLDQAIIEAGPDATLLSILQTATKNMSFSDKANLMISFVSTTKALFNITIAIIVIGIYRVLIRCVIYKKAKKHAWASFIPIYRDAVMLRLCGMSPWWMLLLFIPIIGWAILFIVLIASKFNFAESFDKGVIFSFGLILLPTIFETVIAFSRKTKYIGIEK